MLKFFLFLFILNAFMGLSQADEKIFYEEHVECYFDNTTPDSLIIYNEIDGDFITKLKIKSGHERLRWYKIAIAEAKDGWVKIENIRRVPGPDDTINISLNAIKDKWIKIDHLKINIADMSLPDSLGVPFYSEPNVNSKLICKSGKFLSLNLLATSGLWAKVSFMHNGTNYIAWIQRKHQCAYPWTTCPYNP